MDQKVMENGKETNSVCTCEVEQSYFIHYVAFFLLSLLKSKQICCIASKGLSVHEHLSMFPLRYTSSFNLLHFLNRYIIIFATIANMDNWTYSPTFLFCETTLPSLFFVTLCLSLFPTLPSFNFKKGDPPFSLYLFFKSHPLFLCSN